MSDLAAVGMALSAVLGAHHPSAASMWVVLVVASVALVWRHPVALVVAVGLVASVLSMGSWTGLRGGVSGAVDAPVVLVGDPARVGGAVRVEARYRGHRYDLWARGRAGGALEQRDAGEVVSITGHSREVEPDPWRASRHLVGRIEVDEVVSWRQGSALSRAANMLRSRLMSGAAGLSGDSHALFGGFVLGDDRGRSPEVTDDFQASGLTHLLVVSGSNVAFVLSALAPALRRLGLRSRWISTLGVLVFFAAVTRFEPSVLRATVMAGLTATAATMGRPQKSLRVLASAVMLLVLVDPMLVHSMGFLLSVAACIGIALLSTPLADLMPGPKAIRSAAGVTLAAQIGVSPVLLQLTPGIPTVTVLANLLAEPVAGFVMAWGMTVGVIAGFLPDALASLLHVPTRIALWWIASVARWSGAVPTGAIGAAGVTMVSLGAVAAILVDRKGRRHMALAVLVVAALVAVALPGGIITSTRVDDELTTGAVLWQASDRDGVSGAVLVLDGRVDSAKLLRALRERDVDDIDILVVSSTSSTAESAARAVTGRFHVGERWVPDGTDKSGGVNATQLSAVVPPAGLDLMVGGLEVEVSSVSPRLVVDVSVPGVASLDAPGTGDDIVRCDPSCAGDGDTQPHP